MVPGKGLEPLRYYYQRILSPLRLPITPTRHEYGVPGKIRTYDLCIRRAVLYPAELRGHVDTPHA